MPERTSLERRLAFLGLGEPERQLLAELRPALEQHADRIVAAFYRHLLSFEETARLLVDPAVKDRLLETQRRYLLSLAQPDLEGDYVAERRAIGVTHERTGLSPHWYLGAYSLYFSLLIPIVCELHRGDPTRGERTVDALVKLIMLDAQLAMEAYIEQREVQLEHLNRELTAAQRQMAREVEEQTVELRRTRQRARAAEQLASVATLAAGLAHEIGTPMGVIQGHAELLESAVADERGRWRLRTIREQIERISRIISALLNLARPRPGHYAPTRVADVVEETLSFVREKIRRRGIKVERHFGRAASVRADAEKLQQVFLNLILNAIDAMPGGGTLRVRVSQGEEGRVEVRVADTGVGIPADELPRIFDPFFTTKGVGMGNGLGLVVAAGIVADHGGSIDVESQPGEGTEFRVELPASPAP